MRGEPAMIRWFLVSLLALAAACAHAAMGVTRVQPLEGEEPVTVFYPTSAAEQAVRRGPFALSLAVDAAPVRGNGRLVVISHGSGGNPWVHSNLARALVDAGFVVAMPQHKGDNALDPSHPGPDSWKLRPTEVSHAIDATAKDARFAPLVSLDKVGMYGMSAGGHTALSLAGGRWSPAAFRDHCTAHIAGDFPACVGLITRLNGDVLDGMKQTVALLVIRNRFDDAQWQAHTDRRIAAAVAGVPFAADFDPQSLVHPIVPLGFVTARGDKWLNPKYHSDRILAACATCEVIADVRDGGHGALLSPPPPAEVLGPVARDLLADPPGFDRRQMADIDRRIAAFFTRHLLQ
jgi:predicted dienelactone hydrolase